jgi:hypothetical protein
MMRAVLVGAAAGAAGTAALNAVTYADMAIRGRPASDTPEQVVETVEQATGHALPGDADQQANRRSGVGALAGIVTGVSVGAAYGLARGLGFRAHTLVSATMLAGAAMAVSNGPMTALGVTNPQNWSRADWLSDVIPHVAYGALTAITYAAAEHDR